ncbi:O-antigen ligase family protein [Paraliobacillus zengyii]|uniref:O-antigen ligase family protein n=1 Tax=Paraliobacillus zengyii TaxID=2213194 RepID=UPI001300276C|nr:O-antigen ligase family protein [Paraliobacillus zengyii]
MTESKKKLQSKYMDIVLLLLSTWTFFNYLLPGNLSNIILFASIIVLVFYITLNYKQVIITSNQLLVILITFSLIFVQIISLLYSDYVESTIYRGYLINSILIIGILLIAYGHWHKKAIKYMLIFSIIHTLLTLFSYVFPTGFNTIILPFLPNHIKIDIIWFMSNGFYSGITNQISINAFYISVGISILYSTILAKSKKSSKKEILFLAVLFIALLLTGKRGHLIANVISMMFIAGIYTNIKGGNFMGKMLKVVILLTSLLFAIIIIFPEAASPITRFLEKQDGDITSGRTDLYINALELFSQKPLFGWGTGTFANIYGTGNHNIIFQLLSENGIIGFVTFTVFLLFNFIYTIKKLKNNYYYGNKENDRFYLFSISTQIFFITYGLSGNVLNDEYILMVYVIAIAIPYRLQVLKNNKFITHQ